MSLLKASEFFKMWVTTPNTPLPVPDGNKINSTPFDASIPFIEFSKSSKLDVILLCLSSGCFSDSKKASGS